jgi:hypothetical protein
MKTPLTADSSPSSKISITHLHDALPILGLPRLDLWGESVIGTVSTRRSYWGIHAWLSDACLNFAGFCFLDLPTQEVKRFAQFFNTAQCHDILVERCYIGKDEQSMREIEKSNILNIGRKSYSNHIFQVLYGDYVEILTHGQL